MKEPTILITLGDVAGIGPEIVLRGWGELVRLCRPVVVGDVDTLRHRSTLFPGMEIRDCRSISEARPDARLICVLQATDVSVFALPIGRVHARAGQAAYDFLCHAIDLALQGKADAIVTAPLHKKGLHLAGIDVPGHTEILAARTHSPNHAMVLWGGEIAVAHVTLHMSVREAVHTIDGDAIKEKIELLAELLPRLGKRRPRIGVAALNPHAGDGGLFGDEESRIIAPAIEEAKKSGIDATGPWPADTLFVRALRGEFDGVVAQYHDQGHIPMKLHCGWNLVNITAGLPIIRTSVAHGTAYDIAGAGTADARSLVAATDAACRLVKYSKECHA